MTEEKPTKVDLTGNKFVIEVTSEEKKEEPKKPSLTRPLLCKDNELANYIDLIIDKDLVTQHFVNQAYNESFNGYLISIQKLQIQIPIGGLYTKEHVPLEQNGKPLHIIKEEIQIEIPKHCNQPMLVKVDQKNESIVFKCQICSLVRAMKQFKCPICKKSLALAEVGLKSMGIKKIDRILILLMVLARNSKKKIKTFEKKVRKLEKKYVKRTSTEENHKATIKRLGRVAMSLERLGELVCNFRYGQYDSLIDAQEGKKPFNPVIDDVNKEIDEILKIIWEKETRKVLFKIKVKLNDLKVRTIYLCPNSQSYNTLKAALYRTFDKKPRNFMKKKIKNEKPVEAVDKHQRRFLNKDIKLKEDWELFPLNQIEHSIHIKFLKSETTEKENYIKTCLKWKGNRSLSIDRSWEISPLNLPKGSVRLALLLYVFIILL